MLGSMAVWMRILGTAQWLLDETGSAYWVGFIGVVQLLVQIPMTLWAGTLADRWDRKRLMTFSHGVAGATLVALGVANAAGLLQPLMMYRHRDACRVQTLAGPARSALLHHCSKERPHVGGIDRHRIFERRRNFRAITVCWGCALCGPDHSLLLAGLIALTAGCLPLFISARGQVAPEGSNQSPPKSSKQWMGFAASRNIRFCRAYFARCGDHQASFYREILPVLALGLFAGGAGVTGLAAQQIRLGPSLALSLHSRLSALSRGCWCFMPPSPMDSFCLGSVSLIHSGLVFDDRAAWRSGCRDGRSKADDDHADTPDDMRGRAFTHVFSGTNC